MKTHFTSSNPHDHMNGIAARPDNLLERHMAALSESALGTDLSAVALRQIALAAACRSLEGDFTLFREGEPATTFYVVVSGRVRLSQLSRDGHQIIMQHFGPGAGIGIIVVLSEIAYPLTAVTLEPTTLLAWDKETATYLMRQHAQLALNGLGLIAGRFADLQARYRELSTERVEQRVARTLLRLVRFAGRKVPDGVLIDMQLTRQDLAEMAGTTVYTVSRILSQWEQRGWINGGRERVVLCQPHPIVVIAEDLPEKRAY